MAPRDPCMGRRCGGTHRLRPKPACSSSWTPPPAPYDVAPEVMDQRKLQSLPSRHFLAESCDTWPDAVAGNGVPRRMLEPERDAQPAAARCAPFAKCCEVANEFPQFSHGLRTWESGIPATQFPETLQPSQLLRVKCTAVCSQRPLVSSELDPDRAVDAAADEAPLLHAASRMTANREHVANGRCLGGSAGKVAFRAS
jgi:hypothetical protein